MSDHDGPCRASAVQLPAAVTEDQIDRLIAGWLAASRRCIVRVAAARFTAASFAEDGVKGTPCSVKPFGQRFAAGRVVVGRVSQPSPQVVWIACRDLVVREAFPLTLAELHQCLQGTQGSVCLTSLVDGLGGLGRAP
jgi:hypothetical protein